MIINGGPLASLWGITLVPSSFGPFGGDLLVGNFCNSDRQINAFDPTSGAFLGTLLSDPSFQGLWALDFGMTVAVPTRTRGTSRQGSMVRRTVVRCACNGSRTRITAPSWLHRSIMTSTPGPGQSIADIQRGGAMDTESFEILQSDGTPVGTMFSTRAIGGDPPPGSPRV
jgi:hypothetical protein